MYLLCYILCSQLPILPLMGAESDNLGKKECFEYTYRHTPREGDQVRLFNMEPCSSSE